MTALKLLLLMMALAMSQQETPEEIVTMPTPPPVIEIEEPQELPVEEVSVIETRAIIFSEYGTWDGASGITTASGLTINDFTRAGNFYQYDGYDVLATANTTRLARQLKSGYQSHELYDIIEYELNGEHRTGIVLDVCGACYGLAHEDVQRIDIFTTQSTFGLSKGVIYQ